MMVPALYMKLGFGCPPIIVIHGAYVIHVHLRLNGHPVLRVEQAVDDQFAAPAQDQPACAVDALTSAYCSRELEEALIPEHHNPRNPAAGDRANERVFRNV